MSALSPSRTLDPTSLLATALLTALVAMAPLAIDMFLPSLPAMAEAFATTPGQVQFAVTGFMAAFALSQLLFGPLSDRYGRRGALLAGLALFTVGGVGCMLAAGVGSLVAARAMQGLAAGSGPVISRAVVRDLYTPEQGARVLAYMAMAMSLAPTLAPMLGGVLQATLGWRSVFAVLAILGGLMLLLTWRLLPETNRHIDPQALNPRRMAVNMGTLLRNRRYMGYNAVATFLFCGQFTFITGSSFLIIDTLGHTPQVYGFSFGLVAFGLLLGAFLSSRLVPRLGIDRVVLLGATVSVAFALLMAALAWAGVHGLWPLIGPMYGVTVGTALVMAPSMAGAIAPFPHMAGLASAVLGFLRLSVAAGYATVATLLAGATPEYMVSAIAAADVLALIAFLVLVGTLPATQGNAEVG